MCAQGGQGQANAQPQAEAQRDDVQDVDCEAVKQLSPVELCHSTSLLYNKRNRARISSVSFVYIREEAGI
jgi:hypothetical protein